MRLPRFEEDLDVVDEVVVKVVLELPLNASIMKNRREVITKKCCIDLLVARVAPCGAVAERDIYYNVDLEVSSCSQITIFLLSVLKIKKKRDSLCCVVSTVQKRLVVNLNTVAVFTMKPQYFECLLTTLAILQKG